MRAEVQNYLKARKDLQNIVRNEPYWYRLLSRDPNNISKLEEHARVYYGKTIPQKLDHFNQQLQMISMLLSMSGIFQEGE